MPDSDTNKTARGVNAVAGRRNDMEKINHDNTFDKDLEMLKYFQEEFMFRHNHFWNILIKFFLLTIIFSVLPVTGEFLGVSVDAIPNKYLICFPMLAGIVAIFSLVILLDEAKKMRAVNEAKYRINKKNMDSIYQYVHYGSNAAGTKTNRGLAIKLPWVAFILEIAIIVCSCCVIFGK